MDETVWDNYGVVSGNFACILASMDSAGLIAPEEVAG